MGPPMPRRPALPPRVAARVVLTVSVVLLRPAAAAAEPPPAPAPPGGNASLTLLPNTVHLPADGSDREVTAVLQNLTSDTLTGVRFRPLAEGPVRLSADDTPRDVPPYTETTWVLRVSRPDAEPFPQTVPVLADYARRGSGGAAVARVASQSLALTRPDIETAEPPVGVDINPDFDILHSGRNGKFDVILTNKTATPVRAALEVLFPQSLGPTKCDRTPVKDGLRQTYGPVDLPPRSSAPVSVPVWAASRVRVGKETVVFVVKVEWGHGSTSRTRTVVATRPVMLDVLAQTPLLSFFGSVPLLLFLPGFLTVLTWATLWKWGVFRVPNDKDQFLVQPGTPDFYLVAVMISFALLGVHSLFEFDYVQVYGFTQLVNLYMLSVLLYGAGLYLVAAGLRRWAIRRRTYDPTDGPVETLHKLAARGLGPVLTQFPRGEKGPKLVFLLDQPALSTVRAKSWIAPPIQMTWAVDVGDNVRDELDTLIRAEAVDGGNARKLADYLDAARKCQKAEVKWETSGGINRPTEIDTATVPAATKRELILQVSS